MCKHDALVCQTARFEILSIRRRVRGFKFTMRDAEFIALVRLNCGALDAL